MGDSYFPVIFANIGCTLESPGSIEMEVEKAKAAVSFGADVITDLSVGNNIPEIQNRLLDALNVPLSCVTAYELYFYAKLRNMLITKEEILTIFEQELRRGISIITLHATVFLNDIETILHSSRLIPSTSRGGMMMLDILKANKIENPLFEYFDDILRIARKYNACISLGPTYRFGSICDSSINDSLFVLEMNRMALLVKKAQQMNVGIAIEGIGHAPIELIPQIVVKQKASCFGVPYRVMPVATDIALGCDHIASAIASAIAVQHGANSITCITRSEHIGLPTKNDVVEAVVAARTAAYCGYCARTGTHDSDREMSKARTKNGCIGNVDISISPATANEIASMMGASRNSKECSMCGACCPYLIADTLKAKR
jgi:phosphomethylpyrimidine synthase